MSAGFLSGCATLKGTSTNIKVVSDPPGARVRYKDEVVGTTPGFVKIPRSRNAQLTVEKSDNAVRIPLKRRYRWQDSFVANLFLIVPYLWPIGWITDLATGSAWDYDKITPIELPQSQSDPSVSTDKRTPLNPVRRVAIAPPQGDYELLSEEMGLEIQKLLKKKLPGAEILAYDHTADTFHDFDYTYKGRSEPELDDDLWHDLGITHIAESELKRGESETYAKVRLKDIYSEKEIGALDVAVPNGDLSALSVSRTQEIVNHSFSLIPNAIGFKVLARDQINIAAAEDKGEYTYKTDESTDFLDTVARISLRNLPHRKGMRGFKGRIRLVPDISFAVEHVNVEPTTPAGIAPIEFRWQSFYFGVGPELGLETPVGYLYVQVIPSWAFDYLKSTDSTRPFSEQRDALQANIEFGFAFFITDAINIRISSSNRYLKRDYWENGFRTVGLPDPPQDISHTQTGITISYYFPSLKRFVRGSLL